jgi:ABC-type nitrate/sulfonate/bicarbonate transport system substrate-binding protein
MPHHTSTSTLPTPRRWAALILVATTGLLVAACGGADSACPREIESPADFEGCTVGFKGVVQAEFLAMLNANGLHRDDVELISVGFNPVVLPEGKVDVYPVFLDNEPDVLERVMEAPVRVFTAAAEGVPTLGVGYVASEDGLADLEQREAIRRFLQATMHGFAAAITDPAAAIADTRAFISNDADLVHERFILDTDLGNAQSALTSANGLGWFSEEQFEQLHHVLLEFEGIERPIDIARGLDRSLLESFTVDGELLPLDSIDESERLSLTFMAGFRAQANLPFVAVYVADRRGFFDALGLDVEIQHSSGQGEHIRLLLSGDIDVTTQPASELIQRRADPGAPMVVVALFGQTGDLGYAVLRDRE